MLYDVLFEKTAYGILKPHTDVRDLEKFRQYGYENACTYEKDQAENTPYHAVDLSVYVFKCLQKFVHNDEPPKKFNRTKAVRRIR
jgi:hypothetical protein